MKFITAVSAALSLSSTVLANLPPVTVKGNAFFANNQRFFIRGVDYQPGGSSNASDPLADETICKRDIVEFKKLAINAVRVYTVDNSVSHDACMAALAEAGIYLILDVNTPKYSINRAEPGPSYNAMYLQSIFAAIDSFASYTNTLAFFSGNEVINDDNTTNTAPYVKAVTRDMRKYIKSRGYRQIPVGYSAADVADNRMEMAHYMNCGSDDERSDFFAFNDYSWCDQSSYTISGWDQKVANFSDYSIPLFLSEFGCNKNKRTFTDQIKAMYSDPYAAVFSGGLVYEYSQEASNYGLVEIDDGSVKELADFTALQGAYSTTPIPTGNLGFSTTKSPSQCPPSGPSWDVSGTDLPPFPSAAQVYMTKGAGKGPGLSGAGSQNAGPAASGTAPEGQPSGTGSVSQGGTKKGAASSTLAGGAVLSMWAATCLVGVSLFATLFL